MKFIVFFSFILISYLLGIMPYDEKLAIFLSFAIFLVLPKHQCKISKKIVFLFIISLSFYLMIDTFYVEKVGHAKIVKGFVCTEKAKSIFDNKCPSDSLEALKISEYENNKIWKSWSINFVSYSLLVFWIAFSYFFFIIANSSIDGMNSTLKLNKKRKSKAEGNYYFISYARKDINDVMPLIDAFDRNNIETWFDGDMEYLENWDVQLSSKIRDAKGVVLFLSENSMLSKWVNREITLSDELEKPILIIRLDNSDLRSPLDIVLSRKQTVNVKIGSSEIISILKRFPE